jgi:5-methylcytosine-specific restriction enzyme A
MPTLPASHKPIRAKAREHSEIQRGTAHSRGYTYRWGKARARHLQEQPLCAHCLKADKVTAAREVDHIKPHRGDMTLFWDRDNWQSLCKSCHSRKTATEDSSFASRGRVKKSGSLA